MEIDSKRRKLIQVSLIAPAAAGASERLYGAPASKLPLAGAGADSEKMVLPLANAGIPTEELTDLSRVSALIESVLTDEAAARKFFSEPRQCFEAHGLDGTDSTLIDSSVVLLVALSEPAVRQALAARDYTLFFEYLRVAGVLEPRDPSRLQKRIQELIEANIEDVRSAIREQGEKPLSADQRDAFLVILKQSGALTSEEELAAVARILNGDGMVTIAACSAMAACVVGIAALAALYLSVAVAVTVAVLAGVTISAAVATAIFVGGRQMPQFASPPFTGQFMKLDPVAVRNMQRTYRVAALTEDGQLQLHAMRSVIREEVQAVLVSLVNLELVKLAPDAMPAAIEAVSRYACSAAGIPAPAEA